MEVEISRSGNKIIEGEFKQVKLESFKLEPSKIIIKNAKYSHIDDLLERKPVTVKITDKEDKAISVLELMCCGYISNTSKDGIETVEIDLIETH